MSISRKQFLQNATALLAGSTVLKQNLFAASSPKKTEDCLADFFCTLDFTTDFGWTNDNIKVNTDLCYAKYCDPLQTITDYQDVTYKDEHSNCTNDITPDHKCEHKGANLRYDEFYLKPSKYNYDGCPLPALIYVHGGGFSDCTKKEADDTQFICYEFAKRYFVVYNVEVRWGRVIDYVDGDHTTVQQEMAAYRAFQDVRGAIRTILRRANPTGSEYKIDLNRIFLAGSSAGSVVTLNAAYFKNQNKINQIFPKSSTSFSIQSALGSIDADDFYDCSSTDSTFDYRPRIAGVLNMWGALSLPYSKFNNESSFFSVSDYWPPVISFHGEKDTTFPWIYQNINFSTTGVGESNLNSVTNMSDCINSNSFQTDNDENGSNPDLFQYGSYGFFDRVLRPLKIFREIYLDCDAGHGLGSLGTKAYGINYSTQDDVQIYIIERACTFFQAIIKGISAVLNDDPLTHKNVFEDCKNKRKGCSTVDVYCSESDICVP